MMICDLTENCHTHTIKTYQKDRPSSIMLPRRMILALIGDCSTKDDDAFALFFQDTTKATAGIDGFCFAASSIDPSRRMMQAHEHGNEDEGSLALLCECILDSS